MTEPTEQQGVDLQAALAEFAARCDPNDPEQAAMLEQMKEHTRRLAQLRGDWEKPGGAGSRRLWNSAKAKTPAPAAIQSLKDYKAHVAAEQQRQRHLQQPALLDGEPEAKQPGGSSGGSGDAAADAAALHEQGSDASCSPPSCSSLS